MTTRNLLSQRTIFIGLGALLGCSLWIRSLAAQSGARKDATNSAIISAPGENPQGNNGIDYKNAKPMPLPSVPGSAPSETLPAPPSTGESPGPPGNAPGSTGTGEKHPHILVPPQPLPDTNTAQGQRQ